jgi:hypothetical protein
MGFMCQFMRKPVELLVAEDLGAQAPDQDTRAALRCNWWKKARMAVQLRQPDREKKLAQRLIDRRPLHRR